MTSKSWTTPLGVPRIHLKTQFFQTFLLDFRQKFIEKRWKEQTSLITAERSVLTSFHVRTTPESWWKYTAPVVLKPVQNPRCCTNNIRLWMNWNLYNFDFQEKYSNVLNDYQYKYHKHSSVLNVLNEHKFWLNMA